MNKSRHKQG